MELKRVAPLRDKLYVEKEALVQRLVKIDRNMDPKAKYFRRQVRVIGAHEFKTYEGVITATGGPGDFVMVALTTNSTVQSISLTHLADM